MYNSTVADWDKNTTVIGEQPPRPGSLPEKANEKTMYENKMVRIGKLVIIYARLIACGGKAGVEDPQTHRKRKSESSASIENARQATVVTPE